MLLRTSSGWLAATALVLSALPSGAALATPTAGRSAIAAKAAADHGQSRAERAKETLAEVRAAFAGKRPDVSHRADRAPGDTDGRDLTLLLADLRYRLSDLGAADRTVARSLLARPTDGNKDIYGDGYASNAKPAVDCKVHPTKGSKVCIHWARKTVDAPPLKDSDGDGLPNQVELTRKVMNTAWKRVVTKGGFHRPLKDTRGPDGRLDIYLADIGGQGLYGYCAPEKHVSGRAFTGYCVLDDDYSSKQFPSRTPKQNLAVTAAHEFFHTVQFAYDVVEDPWFMEGSAAWVEDEIYNAVNDNRQYLAYSPLQDPTRPLDTSSGLTVYGSWIWWRYLTERFPYEGGSGLPRIMLELWRRADNSGRTYAKYPSRRYSLQAVDGALALRGTDLPTQFGGFVLANRRPDESYTEGAAYPNSPVEGTATLTTTTPVNGSVDLDHLSAATYRINRGAAFTKLKVDVDLPDLIRTPRAHVTIFFTDGHAEVTEIALDANGVGSLANLAFTASVDHVELALINASTVFTCNQGTGWSCAGTPRDDSRTFSFTLTPS